VYSLSYSFEQGKNCDKEVWHDHLSFENMTQVSRSTHNDTAAASRFSKHANGVLDKWLADDERDGLQSVANNISG
jgi:hypothetical protein